MIVFSQHGCLQYAIKHKQLGLLDTAFLISMP